MKYANLGRSGLKVSRLCLGSYNFGSKTDEKEAFAIMAAPKKSSAVGSRRAIIDAIVLFWLQKFINP
jgi:hypothetical protein